MSLCAKACAHRQTTHPRTDDHDARHGWEPNYARVVNVARLSLTPLKGTAHESLKAVSLDLEGPRHDRRFCLVDPARARVLRTVENPALVSCQARYDGTSLAVRLPDGSTVVDVVGDRVAQLEVDYWGRRAAVHVISGPWARAFSALLAQEVLLAEVDRPGQVVFGGSVTLLTTSSLRELAARLGRVLDGEALLVDSERFRSTVAVDTGTASAFVEDSWVGREITLGAATVRVRGPVPRCAVVRLRPRDGRQERPDPLRALAWDRTEVNERGREVVFGVDAQVVRPGVVRVGDPVTAGQGTCLLPETDSVGTGDVAVRH